MPPIQWDRCLGAIETLSPWAVPDGFATSAVNVDLSPHVLMKPRAGFTGFPLTSGPSERIVNLFTERTPNSKGDERLWAFSYWQTAPAAHAYTASLGWSSVSLSDTASAYDAEPQGQVSCCAHNGKVFVAYNSNVNRLHVSTDGGAMRRVGLDQPAAPTVANTGSGSYAATARYYKVQMSIRVVPTSYIALSELSNSQSFTPSGSGTAARITKPTTVDSATHWRVFGSANGLTFYAITGWIAVGTTTWDDSGTPATYSTPVFGTGEVAPEVGLYVPPPSARFLATNGERVFMAGAFETSASGSETAVSNRRVWFTRPLSAIGADDESITQTAESRYYLDINNEDGSPITGLCSAIDGSVYVGTGTSVWRLSDTGLPDRPIRAERVVAGIGPASHWLMTVSDAVDGGMLYFGAEDGPYRYAPTVGLQYIGSDWVIRDAAVGSIHSPYLRSCTWDQKTRRIIWLYAGENTETYSQMRVLDPSLLSNVDGVWRGGWSLDQLAPALSPPLYCATVFGNTLLVGGASSTGGIVPDEAVLLYRDETLSQDDGEDYTATLVSKSWIPHDGTRLVRTEEPYIWKRRNLSVAMELTRNRGGSGNTASDTAASESIGVGETSWHQAKVEGLVQADASSLELTLTVAAPIITANRHTDVVDRVVIPVMQMESR